MQYAAYLARRGNISDCAEMRESFCFRIDRCDFPQKPPVFAERQRFVVIARLRQSSDAHFLCRARESIACQHRRNHEHAK
jgi:hypothetical protein